MRQELIQACAEAVKKTIAQGQRCVNKAGSCVYDNGQGQCCAIGHMIAPHLRAGLYGSVYVALVFRALTESLGFEPTLEERETLRAIQYWHDRGDFSLETLAETAICPFVKDDIETIIEACK